MQIFDSLTLAAVVAELNAAWRGARIEKLHFPTPHELVMSLRGAQSRRLYCSLRGNFSRMHLTERRFENPPQPPMFCMLLRKHLEGSRILRFEQLELERVVQIITAGRDELGDPTERALVAEITGKHANLILLDAPHGRILGSLRTVTAEISRERQIMPGLLYDPPPISSQKRDPRLLSANDLLNILAAGGTAEAALLKGVHSLGRAAITQLLCAADIDPKAPGDALDLDAVQRLASKWRLAFENVEAGRFEPRVEEGPGWEYRVLSFEPQSAVQVPVSPMLDQYYGTRELAERLESQRASLYVYVRERLSKLEKKLASLREVLETGVQAETLRQWGELIQAYGYNLPPRSTSLVADNYFREGAPPVTIPLESRLSPMENAQRYFRRYQKAKAGMEISQRFLAEAEAEFAYWKEVETGIALSETPQELAEIRAEWQPPAPSKHAKAQPASEPLRFRSSDGVEILVGKNNRQNDLVTMKLARPDDWWFHAQNLPGSHVVAKSATLSEQTRMEAAMLAAYYSQARESTKVPVIFTQRRHLKKPTGAKPGLVIYEREKSMLISPDAARIATLERLDSAVDLAR